MKKCNLCNSENLMESAQESRLIPGAKYVNCKSCGNVMILSNNVLIPTPQDNNKMTQAMIEDAAIAFSNNAQLMAASLTGKNFENEIQPTTVQNLMQAYVENFLEDMDTEEEEYEYCGCFDDCDDCDEEYHVLSEEDVDETISLAAVETRSESIKKDYLLVKNGNKQIYANVTKLFMNEIINSINGEFKLYELNEVKPHREVKYSL